MKGKGNVIISWIILITFAFSALFPVYLLILNSFKTRSEIFSDPFRFPKDFSFSNYIKAWGYADLGCGLLNSFILGSLSAVFTTLIAGIAAYALARRARGSSYTITFLMFCNTLPFFIVLIPLYVWFYRLGLTNLIGVIIISVGTGLPFSILLLRSFLLAIPKEIEEAALIDGANKWQIFWRIILPLARSGFLTVGLLTFLGGWNSFTLPLTFLTNPDQQTAIIKIYNLTGQYTSPWGQIFAAIVIVSLPTIVLFLAFQRYFIQGLIGGAFKY
ncbi:MAG: carbohydrate ABC transporter permease [Staphylothermus sp.]|nr:carbohydrate ABC transporter permease [Staphylothermus sp.]